jgi:hypothetical protein
MRGRRDQTVEDVEGMRGRRDQTVEDVEGMEDVEIKPWRAWRAGGRRDQTVEDVEGMAFAEQAHPGARGGPEKNRAGDVA